MMERGHVLDDLPASTTGMLIEHSQVGPAFPVLGIARVDAGDCEIGLSRVLVVHDSATTRRIVGDRSDHNALVNEDSQGNPYVNSKGHWVVSVASECQPHDLLRVEDLFRMSSQVVLDEHPHGWHGAAVRRVSGH